MRPQSAGSCSLRTAGSRGNGNSIFGRASGDERRAPRRASSSRRPSRALHDEKIGAAVAEREHEAQAHRDASFHVDLYRGVGVWKLPMYHKKRCVGASRRSFGCIAPRQPPASCSPNYSAAKSPRLGAGKRLARTSLARSRLGNHFPGFGQTLTDRSTTRKRRREHHFGRSPSARNGASKICRIPSSRAIAYIEMPDENTVIVANEKALNTRGASFVQLLAFAQGTIARAAQREGGIMKMPRNTIARSRANPVSGQMAIRIGADALPARSPARRDLRRDEEPDHN